MMKPAVLLALCLGLGVQALPEKGSRNLVKEARAAQDVAFVCFEPADKAICEDDMQCDCFCDVEAQVTCNGGANCPDIVECLDNCVCNICS